MMKLDYDITFYIEGFECDIEDYTRILGVIFIRKFIEYLNKI